MLADLEECNLRLAHDFPCVARGSVAPQQRTEAETSTHSRKYQGKGMVKGMWEHQGGS